MFLLFQLVVGLAVLVTVLVVVVRPRYAGNPRERVTRGVAAVIVLAAAVFAVFGLSLLETSLWAGYAAFAAVEAVIAVLLTRPRWRHVPAAVTIGLMAIYQAGQSYFHHRFPATAADSVIPVDMFGTILFALVALALLGSVPAGERTRPSPLAPTPPRPSAPTV